MSLLKFPEKKGICHSNHSYNSTYHGQPNGGSTGQDTNENAANHCEEQRHSEGDA